ncbi:hypothetical protein [Sphingomonas sp.]|uniref:hypothetical protein n=1 Tax=Sphingomonas sp. TaxID=28214 RepID=UPI0038B3DDD3
MFALIAVPALVALIFYEQGYRAGLSEARHKDRFQVNWNGSEAQTKDAIQRWLAKNHARELKETYPVVMSFPDRNCIQLKMELGGVGGEPIYCYRANSLQLVEEVSDVE